VRIPIKQPLGIALLLFAPLAVAQTKLGELLDAGAKPLSPEEFKQELVQRVLVGPTATGLNLEIMYTTSGTVQGLSVPAAQVNGEWTIDAVGRVCTAMRLIGPTFGVAGGGSQGTTLPARCQSWYRLADRYFLSDSDTDRQARVLVRTVKQ